MSEDEAVYRGSKYDPDKKEDKPGVPEDHDNEMVYRGSKNKGTEEHEEPKDDELVYRGVKKQPEE